jgi:hypothetical protein
MQERAAKSIIKMRTAYFTSKGPLQEAYTPNFGLKRITVAITAYGMAAKTITGDESGTALHCVGSKSAVVGAMAVGLRLSNNKEVSAISPLGIYVQ